jgi:hypothetical protein
MARKEWFDSPATATPLSASALNDLEARKIEAQWFHLFPTEQPYNAVGDATVDDTAAFASAIAAAGATGRRLFVPAGTYRVGDLAYPNDGCIVEGAQLGPQYFPGKICLLKAWTGATYTVRVEGLLYTRTENIVIDGNAHASRGMLIQATSVGSQSHALDGVRFQQCSIGLLLGTARRRRRTRTRSATATSSRTKWGCATSRRTASRRSC